MRIKMYVDYIENGFVVAVACWFFFLHYYAIMVCDFGIALLFCSALMLTAHDDDQLFSSVSCPDNGFDIYDVFQSLQENQITLCNLIVLFFAPSN